MDDYLFYSSMMDVTPDGRVDFGGNEPEAEAAAYATYTKLVETFQKRIFIFSTIEVHLPGGAFYFLAAIEYLVDRASVLPTDDYSLLSYFDELDTWLRTGNVPFYPAFKLEKCPLTEFWQYLHLCKEKEQEFLWRFLKRSLVDNFDQYSNVKVVKNKKRKMD